MICSVIASLVYLNSAYASEDVTYPVLNTQNTAAKTTLKPSSTLTAVNLDPIDLQKSSLIPPTSISNTAAVENKATVLEPLEHTLPVQTVFSNLWERLRSRFSMPDLDTKLAQEKTAWYANQPDYLARMTQRSSQYLYFIVDELEKRNMPSELALLPFIESAFNPWAVSSAKAAGMWQFMPATGKYFNLKQNLWQDERRDVIESTRAALDYLEKLHGMFGDWHLALAAYNWGEGSVQRAINKNKARGLPTAYTDLKMPNETQHYVPKFQAVKNIILSPEQYGIELTPLVNAPFFTSIIKDKDIDVELAAKFAGLSLAEFKALNPGFKTPVILGATKPEILLPANKLEEFKSALENHIGPLSSWTSTRVNTLQKPNVIAKQFGISEAQLREINNIPARMLIKPGSILVVPKNGAQEQDSNISASIAESGQLNFAPEAIKRIHTVRKGDSLASIAKRFGVSQSDIMGWNSNISSNVYTGQKVTLYVAIKQTKPRAVASKKQAQKTSKKT